MMIMPAKLLCNCSQCHVSDWMQSLVLLEKIALIFFPLYWSLFLIFVDTYRPPAILSAFSKAFEFVIHENISHYLKIKFNSTQHAFTKTKTTTNLVTFLIVTTTMHVHRDNLIPSILIPMVPLTWFCIPCFLRGLVVMSCLLVILLDFATNFVIFIFLELVHCS